MIAHIKTSAAAKKANGFTQKYFTFRQKWSNLSIYNPFPLVSRFNLLDLHSFRQNILAKIQQKGRTRIQ